VFYFVDPGCSSSSLQNFAIVSIPKSFKSNLQWHAPFFCSLLYCTVWISQVVIALVVFRRNFTVKFYFLHAFFLCRRFRWPRGLRHGSAAGLLGLRVRIPPGAWIFVSSDCYVFCAGRVLCDVPVSRPGKSYRVQVCVCVWSAATLRSCTYVRR